MMLSGRYCLLLHLLLQFFSPVVVVGRYTLFDADTAKDCAERVSECRTSPTTFFECSETCPKSLQPTIPPSPGKAFQEDLFYDFTATKANGKTIDFEQFDGYVTLLVVLPMIEGMAQFYYEMAEHLLEVRPYTLTAMILPFQSNVEGQTDPNLQLKLVDKPRTILLETYEGKTFDKHYLVRYLELVEHMAEVPPLEDDKATLYLVSMDGTFIERRICPTKRMFEDMTVHYLEQLDFYYPKAEL